MDLQLFNPAQYMLLSQVGKKFVLPLFITSISDITSCITVIKAEPLNKVQALRTAIEDSDLEFKIMAIVAFLEEISEENYESKTIRLHLNGIYEVLSDIKNELDIFNSESEYIKSSWYHYMIGWSYYRSSIRPESLKKYIILLNNRYDMLLKLLSVRK